MMQSVNVKTKIMKVCGIDLKGNDAVITCLEGDENKYNIILSKTKKVKLKDSNSQEDIKLFLQEISRFLEENNFDHVGIKARATKGRFAGGSVSFKMEGLIQSTEANVVIIHNATIKSKLKSKMDKIDVSAVLSYQKDAFNVAIYLLTVMNSTL